MVIYVKISLFPYFLFFFLVFKHDFIRYALILPISQLQREQVVTSHIRSRIEYLIHTYLYSCAHFVVEKYRLNDGF